MQDDISYFNSIVNTSLMALHKKNRLLARSSEFHLFLYYLGVDFISNFSYNL